MIIYHNLLLFEPEVRSSCATYHWNRSSKLHHMHTIFIILGQVIVGVHVCVHVDCSDAAYGELSVT